MESILTTIRKQLRVNADKKIKESTQRYFKDEAKLYGMNSATMTQIGKENFELIKHKSKKEIHALCEELMKSGFLEEAGIACMWSYNIRSMHESTDISLFERWIDNYITNWATCDTLCNHTVGSLLEKYPEHVQHLKRWAGSDNRWMKRAAAVSLIIPARKGLFLSDVFEISDTLLTDKDDIVQKGYGWMLKAASNKHTKEVYEYVISKKKVMPRTAYRYAIEKMPAEMRAKAMEK
ncbi:MAG: DNA alkylation repair protein [Bacteroidales bacterium]|nr:DNA alkylation repair protein [Bacteroidales bacterium]